jgi:hypothetical protein
VDDAHAREEEEVVEQPLENVAEGKKGKRAVGGTKARSSAFGASRSWRCRSWFRSQTGAPFASRSPRWRMVCPSSLPVLSNVKMCFKSGRFALALRIFVCSLEAFV